ncbi:hypothetical protein, partial [Bartonella sp. CL46QHWL]|uniref:hypothetical protein n=1 Tax=Bartonella sp. CL46QHWL TaxID=3243534 RepID=UPI0035D0B7EE
MHSALVFGRAGAIKSSRSDCDGVPAPNLGFGRRQPVVVTSVPMLNVGICRRRSGPRALVVTACRRIVEAL